MNDLNAQIRQHTKGWPEPEARQYEWGIVLANLWFALAEHPLVRRIPLLRQHFEREQLDALHRAAMAENEALTLLAVAEFERRPR